MLQANWREAIKLTMPILMGYMAAGIAYGMLATASGLPIWFTLVMCFTVYSGTAQYAAIPFFVSGAGIIAVFLSILLMSLRFVFYTLNMHSALPQDPLKRIVSTAYLTDESFAVLTTVPPEKRQDLLVKVGILGVLYWTLATVIGILLGDSVSSYIPNLDFALPCLFAILAYEQYRTQKQWKPMLIALIGFVLAQQISRESILLVAILISIGLVMLLPQKWITKE